MMIVQSMSLSSGLRRLLVCAGLSVLACAVQANGEYKVYGTDFAWNNDFNKGTINVGFGSGSTANMTVWQDETSYNLYGYPACIRGWHYGFNPANDNLFPKQMSSIHTCPVTFSYSSGYSGSGSSNMAGDFAYDLFFRNDNQKSSPQLEMMVWAGNDSYPIGSQTGTNVLSTGGYTFDFWQGYNSAAGYETYTFIPHGTAGQGTLPTSGSLNVDIKTFTNWLANNGKSSYNNSMYLDVVEAGLEWTRGYGWAWVEGTVTAS
jgi:hypothetical protein